MAKWSAIALMLVVLAACTAAQDGAIADSSGAVNAPEAAPATSLLEPRAADSELLGAIHAGDAGQVRSIIARGEHATGEIGGYPWLELAASQKPCVPEVLSALIEHGFDPHHVEATTGSTALHVAATSGSRACVDRLLSQGADPAQVDLDSRGLIVSAYFSGEPDLVSGLLSEDGLRLNEADLALALLFALKKSDWNSCAQLLEAGANPETEFKYGPERMRVADLPEGAWLGRCQSS